MPRKLLDAFAETFRGHEYRHRKATTGDAIATHIYEDIYSLGRSNKFTARVADGLTVLNTRNLVKGKKGRRGDGTFGELIPGEKCARLPGFDVARGPVATVEIGVEVKILATAMIKQIDRVINDLRNQAATFRRLNPKSVAIGIVGVNYSYNYVSFEGDRCFRSEPIKEAKRAQARLIEGVGDAFDELLVLPFAITNESPHPFAWPDERDTEQHYNSAILRVSNLYESRF